MALYDATQCNDVRGIIKFRKRKFSRMEVRIHRRMIQDNLHRLNFLLFLKIPSKL